MSAWTPPRRRHWLLPLYLLVLAVLVALPLAAIFVLAVAISHSGP